MTENVYRSENIGCNAFLLTNFIEKERKKNHVHLLERESDIIQFKDLINFFNKEIEIIDFPSWDCLPYGHISPGKSIISKRFSALLNSQSSSQKPKIFLASSDSILQKTLPKDFLLKGVLELSIGKNCDMDEIKVSLVQLGYLRETSVYSPGEYSVRGGIVDIFPAGLDFPVRLEFFGNVLEKIRAFDPNTQITFKILDSVQLLLASEVTLSKERVEEFRKNYRKNIGKIDLDDSIYNLVSQNILPEGIEHWLSFFYSKIESVLCYLKDFTISFDTNFDNSLEKKWQSIVDAREFDLNQGTGNKHRLALLEPTSLYLSPSDFREELKSNNLKTVNLYESKRGQIKYSPGKNFVAERNNSQKSLFSSVIDHIHYKKGYSNIIITGFSIGSIERLISILKEYGLEAVDELKNFNRVFQVNNKVFYSFANFDAGFEMDNFLIITEQDILGGELRKKEKKSKKPTSIFEDLKSIREGDLVVHIDFGIGRFLGLKNIEINKIKNDFLEIEYDNSDKIFVPIENIELISLYGSHSSKLDRLGAASWQQRKANVKKRIKVIAQQLINVAAKRMLVKTQIVSIQEDVWKEFSDRFPYVETDDQLSAIFDVKKDLSSGTPMDRLICGDVGFGKTEVAMRASFLIVSSSKQVVIVVPTTLLAKQHLDSFKKRFDSYPINIEMLSRLTPRKNAKDILENVSLGGVDILIGTHSVLSKKVEFKDLGLAVIDEEQSFGVDQKEKLKLISPKINILTLTATPIPRTLQMAFSGIRDLSLINTPPKNRTSIETTLMEFDSGSIRSAILREVYRGGQVFFVVPRIKDISFVEEFLVKNLSEVKFKVASGKLSNNNLERIITDFYDGTFDLLVSTNIVGSGLDVPRANTIIIYKPDMFGLSQLYQIRGRVGRSNRRAFAFLVTKKGKILSEGASRRLKLLASLNSMVSGFSLSSQDLEIRGSGNMLGEEQTGQIEEVGSFLYQDMLEKTVKNLKEINENKASRSIEEHWSPTIKIPISARIPEDYIQENSLRLSFYRRLSSLQQDIDIESLLAEMVDRFGSLPDEVKTLVSIIKIREKCKKLQIDLFEAGAKGIIINFKEGKFFNTKGLINFIESDRENIFIKNNKLLVKVATRDKKTIIDSCVNVLKNMHNYI
ncbi:MAG: transcription-repair coupling factor [Rhodobacteraceae bacterium]|nr:MAG: transcription-repair coupling factor [Paracoccaceae bacterium]